jgi:photosystem I subunit 11
MVQAVESIDRSKDRPRDPRNQEVVHAAANNPQIGNLETPINASPIVKAYINNLPAYRQGLSPFRRGLEVGLAHGYWIVGPFYEFNPLRDTEVGGTVALLATLGLIVISTLAISLYASSIPPRPVATITTPNPPADYFQPEGWNEYAGGFFLGGVGGALFAYGIVSNIDVFSNILHLLGQ